MKKLRDRVAVVTGAAQGIGYGLSVRFLQEGMKVVLADKDAEQLKLAAQELSALGEILAVQTDVADARSVEGLRDAAVARFGAVHVLCNNAGVGGIQRFSTISEMTWEWTVGVNLWGVIHGCRIFLPVLAEQDEAYIVNTASMAGFTTGPYQADYKVTKAGVVALSESLSNEFAVEFPNVKVAVLCPAHTATAIRHEERNAPEGHIPRAQADPKIAELREKVYRAIEQEGISPAVVADMVVKAMAAQRTHVFPHPEWLDTWQQRVDLVKMQAAPFTVTV
ncbi:SDR family NAD(P)-dependent oxidoreductase [Rhodococcus sp. (in: high G+C Gram-positive bacteria)]|uniref:SDR family NAD(P)-dependent oxidoreductase n=1 Tax=Rhodococcus sp. TaxID=1831 RepID=UPI00257DDB8D|nr:SDR family NAD(P)-dependent oxidoreductase [Rhodococcus sp. (in: high G+C Gram-positive bacteria)]MBQ7803104.1 SDR family NAD(P)-dependent oxidoreductase [Rhodococcus sp. (in: high G+C Gram-positive bacteria)]